MAITNKKLERELHGPGLLEIILGVGLSLIIGVLLGAAHLVFKPVAKAPKPGDKPAEVVEAPALYPTVTFLAGSADKNKGSAFASKQTAFLAGPTGEIVLTEDELNAFIAAAVPPPPAPPPPAPAKPATPPADKSKPAAPAAKPAAPAFAEAKLATGVINFRLHDGVLQAALAGNYSVLGIEVAPLVQLRGSFVKGADGFVFQPAEFYLGSLPVHKIPGLSGWVLNKLLAAQKDVPEGLKTSWKKLGTVAVEGDTLKLSP